MVAGRSDLLNDPNDEKKARLVRSFARLMGSGMGGGTCMGVDVGVGGGGGGAREACSN